MPKDTTFKIKYAIAILVCIILSYYFVFELNSGTYNSGEEINIAIRLFFFFGLAFAALRIVNLLYYLWFTYLSCYSIIAKKHGFKRIGFMSQNMRRVANNIEYEVYTNGHVMDRNIIFRTELKMIIDNKSKNKYKYNLNDFIKLYSPFFIDIHEINKNTTFSFKKVDYFRDVDLIEYFNIIEEIIQMHDPVNNQTEKGVKKSIR